MKYPNRIKIGICGGVHDPLDEEVKQKAFMIGKEVAKQGCVLVSGATLGYPREAAKGAIAMGGISLGISPADGKTQHAKEFKYPLDVYDPIVYTGFGLQGRNVILIRSSDAVIFIGGGSGTLNEFTIAFRLGKPLGVLKGSGLISENLDTVIKICKRSSPKPFLIHHHHPETLVKEIVKAVKKKITRW